MKIDVFSTTWMALETRIKADLQILREENDNPNLSERETQFFRGQIYALKELLKLKEENQGAQ